ncbi:MAG TPA: VOC family protein [Iamia sp.]
MASLLNPYLMFNGTAREAMTRYQEIFGGDLEVMTFGDAGATGGGPPPPDGVMHSYLGTPQGFALMGSDAPPGVEVQPGTTMAVSLSGDDVEDLTRFWEQLSEGGTIEVPFERQMWGDTFGQCTDRFGVSWMVNVTSS